MPKERTKNHSETEEAKRSEVCQKRSYYYDDAHGYEEYDPKLDAEDEKVDESED